jgi:NTP pyrophosphatase (non-canonical NTP hydrolase)
MSDQDLNSFSGLLAAAEAFRDERDWRQFHTLKNLAAAIAIEAAELQEVLLWSSEADEPCSADLEGLRDELADILIHCANFASLAGIDIASALKVKFEKNAAKYPPEKSKGSAAKYNTL